MPRKKRKKYIANIDWKDFNGEEIILPICPRSPGVRGRNFLATVKELSSKINHAHVILIDTLNRYNLFGQGKDAEQQAIANGREWLSKSQSVLEEAGFSYDLNIWNKVRADASFEEKLGLMKALYNTNVGVKRVVNNIASYYLVAKKARSEREGLPFNETDELQRSAAYLIEEFAGTSVYGGWWPGLPEAYWGVYVGEMDVFNRLNDLNSNIDLSLPVTLPVSLNRLDPPIAGDNLPAPKVE